MGLRPAQRGLSIFGRDAVSDDWGWFFLPRKSAKGLFWWIGGVNLGLGHCGLDLFLTTDESDDTDWSEVWREPILNCRPMEIDVDCLWRGKLLVGGMEFDWQTRDFWVDKTPVWAGLEHSGEMT